MNNVATFNSRILPSSKESIAKVEILHNRIKEELVLTSVDTHHVIHGGMYARTIKILAGTVIAGALVKVATVLITQGNVLVSGEDKTVELDGYNVFAASANRKQAFYAISDVWLTTVFPTQAKTVKEAEEEFTNECNLLLSRRHPETNTIIITGE